MSNRAHIKWIFNLLKELKDDDDHKHDSHDPTFEVERQLMAHFSVHPQLNGQFKHPTHNMPCILCDCKPFKLVGDV
jgi:hypothetical protein